MVDFLLNITYNENTKNASYQVQQKVGVCMNTIITIGRQFGSAAGEIGERLQSISESNAMIRNFLSERHRKVVSVRK